MLVLILLSRHTTGPGDKMPTILTHTAVPLSIAIGAGSEAVSRRLLYAGVVASMLPDIDVMAFRFGIPYAADWGHRGLSHSLVFALIVAILGISFARLLASTPGKTFSFLFMATASHGVLDAFTNGGLGVAMLWPFSQDRFFFPYHPIEVAPIGLSRIMSPRGMSILRSEIIWVWLPCLSAAGGVFLYRSLRGISISGRGSTDTEID